MSIVPLATGRQFAADAAILIDQPDIGHGGRAIRFQRYREELQREPINIAQHHNAPVPAMASAMTRSTLFPIKAAP